MHELGIAAAILEAAEETLREHGRQRLLRVEVAVGELTAVLPENLAFCFGVLAEDRPALSGARLEVTSRPLVLHCRDCGREGRPPRPDVRCPFCGGTRTDIRSGEELEIIALEVE